MTRPPSLPGQSTGPGSPGAPRPVERRASVRFPCELESSCQPVTASTAVWPAIIRDLSRIGAAVAVTRRFEPGTVLHLDIHRGGGDVTSLYVRVTRVTQPVQDEWLLGCTFARPLSPDDVDALLA